MAAGDGMSRRELVRWRNAILTAFLLGGVTMAAFGSRLPSIQQSLDATKGTIGTILAGTTVGSLIGLSVAGWMHTRLGPRIGIRSSLLIAAVGLALTGLGAGSFHSVPITGLGLAVMGFGIGTVDVQMNIEGALVEQAFGKTLMPLMHAAWSAGVILGAGIGAGSAALKVPFQWQFVAEAVVVAAATVWLSLGIPRHQAAPVSDEEKAPLGERMRKVFDQMRDPRLIFIGLVMLGAELGEGSANSWLTLAARTEHGYVESVAGMFFVLFAASETLARVLGGPVVDRIGRTNAIRVTSALGMVGIAVFIIGGPWWVIGAGVLLWAFGVSMGFPLGMSAAADSGPNPAARVTVVATIGYAANLAGPPALGHLADAVGLLKAMWVLVALFCLALLCAPAVRKGPAASEEAPTGA